MKKIIIGFLVAGVLIVLGVSGFLFFMKDESKVAEIINEVKEDDANFENTKKTIAEKIVDNVPKLEEKVSVKDVEINNEIKSSTKSGMFIKIDPLHYASGQVKVEKAGENYKLVFQNNFSAAPGPDLYVYLSAPQSYKNIAVGGLDTAKTVNIGVLKSGKGTQEYLVSKGDFEKYGDAVVIWCKQFGVQFSRAELR